MSKSVRSLAPFQPSPVSVAMVCIGGILVAHPAVLQQFCISHPFSLNCDNAIAPGPEIPHEFPRPLQGPTGTVLLTNVSTSATVTGPTGVIMR
jgi:hypothetical protein